MLFSFLREKTQETAYDGGKLADRLLVITQTFLAVVNDLVRHSTT